MIKKHRILVCGGRDFSDMRFMERAMDALVPYFNPRFCLIHGGCSGADTYAGSWAQSKGTPVIVMDANWDFYKGSAGPIRNEWMIKYCWPDLVIAFPGGNGTANMVKLAKREKIDVYEI